MSFDPYIFLRFFCYIKFVNGCQGVLPNKSFLEKIHPRITSVCFFLMCYAQAKIPTFFRIFKIIQKKQSLLNYLFQMHPFSTLWKHQKTLRIFDVFRRRWRKGALETDGFISRVMFTHVFILVRVVAYLKVKRQNLHFPAV